MFLTTLAAAFVAFGCGDPPPPPEVDTLSISTHSKVRLSWAVPPSWKIDERESAPQGWSVTDTESAIQGYFFIGESNPSLFANEGTFTEEDIRNQASLDFRTLVDNMLDTGGRIKDNPNTENDEFVPGAFGNTTLLVLEELEGRTFRGQPSLTRLIRFSVPELLRSTPRAYLDFFMDLLEGELESIPDSLFENEIGNGSFTFLYHLAPMVDANEKSISVGNTPGFVRFFGFSPATDEDTELFYRQYLLDHMSSGYFANEANVEVTNQTVDWTIPDRNAPLALAVIPNISRSIERFELEHILEATPKIEEVLTAKNFLPTTAVYRACDGEPQRGFVGGNAFNSDEKNTAQFIVEQTENARDDSSCSNGNYQGITTFEKLVDASPAEFEDIPLKLAILISDADDQSRDLDCQDCILTSNYQAQAQKLKNSGWEVLAVYPRTSCVVDHIRSPNSGARLLGFTTAYNATSVDICLADWQETLVTELNDILARSSPYQFENPPLSHSVSVAFRDENLVRNDARGWQYNSQSAAIEPAEFILDAINETLRADYVGLKVR